MKIVVNSRFLTQKITGSQRFAIEIAKQLKRFMQDVFFVTPKNIIHKNLVQKLNAKIIGTTTGHLWEQIELPLYLKKIGSPLLINLVNTAPLIYKNKLITIHDIRWKHFPDSVSKIFYLYYNFLIPKIARNSLHIFTVSNFSKKDIAANLKIPEYKFSVLYNGVSNCFKCLNLEKQKIILSVATLHPCKNIKSLIKAFISLKANYKEFQGYKLVLVGEINSRIFKNSHVISLINNRKDIELTGHISDRQLVILYNKAEVFVLPSKFEGFGIPPIEAMACGCPVVVSNIPALREVCEDGAYYVDPYNINSIAQGIYKVLTDENLKKSLIVNGLKRVKLFSWENTVKKLIKIINEIRDENSYNS